MADVFGGAIYRVDVASGATEKVYQHAYGINSAVRDSKGTIWFTQSAMNTPEDGEGRMWAAVDTPRPEGALLRLPMVDGKLAARAEVVVDSLLFGNGVAVDEAAGKLYVAETVAGRVLRYDVDLATGALSGRTVFVDSVGADNLELDGEGHLWVALPLGNEILVVNTATGARHVAFKSQTPAQAELLAEFMRRGAANEPRVGMIGPALWAPLPGPPTGVILGSGTESGLPHGVGKRAGAAAALRPCHDPYSSKKARITSWVVRGLGPSSEVLKKVYKCLSVGARQDRAGGRAGRPSPREVQGPLTEIDLPPMPAKPTSLVFNDLSGVLADVSMERW